MLTENWNLKSAWSRTAFSNSSKCTLSWKEEKKKFDKRHESRLKFIHSHHPWFLKQRLNHLRNDKHFKNIPTFPHRCRAWRHQNRHHHRYIRKCEMSRVCRSRIRKKKLRVTRAKLLNQIFAFCQRQAVSCACKKPKCVSSASLRHLHIISPKKEHRELLHCCSAALRFKWNMIFLTILLSRKGWMFTSFTSADDDFSDVMMILFSSRRHFPSSSHTIYTPWALAAQPKCQSDDVSAKWREIINTLSLIK